MKKCTGRRYNRKEVGREDIYNCGSCRHFGILGCRNALWRDYVKEPYRSVAAEANRVENSI
jgi:hypothetical protein